MFTQTGILGKVLENIYTEWSDATIIALFFGAIMGGLLYILINNAFLALVLVVVVFSVSKIIRQLIIKVLASIKVVVNKRRLKEYFKQSSELELGAINVF